MGKIFYIMGKSSSGKDTIYKKLLGFAELSLKKIVLYTTRPIREGEKEGVEYYFTEQKKLDTLLAEGKVIECRTYQTLYGEWKYFSVNDAQINLEQNNYLAMGTLDSYQKYREYYGEETLVPIYIEVENGIRLERALLREKNQKHAKYDEMCRRFLADEIDFSEEKITALGIKKRFHNNELTHTIDEIVKYINDIVK